MSCFQPILCETEYDLANVQVTPEIVEEIEIHDSKCECHSCVNKHNANIQMIKEDIKEDIDGYIQKRKQERDAYIQKMNDERDAYIQKFKKEMDDFIELQNKNNEIKMKEETERKLREESERKLREESERKLREETELELVRQKYVEQYNKFKEIRYQCDIEYHNLIKISEEYYSMENKYTYNIMPKKYYPMILPKKYTIQIGNQILYY